MVPAAMRAQPIAARLDWESAHFGIEAAQLTAPVLTDAELVTALSEARKAGVRLVVWPAEPERDVQRAILEGFGGALIDRKATFTRDLTSLSGERPDSALRR